MLYFTALFFNKEPSFSSFDIKSFRALDPCQCHAEAQVTEVIHRAATGEWCRDGMAKGMQEARGGRGTDPGRWAAPVEASTRGTQVVKRAGVSTSYFIES